MRVPAYSPNAVAEHTLALILCLNRHIHRAYVRVRDGNFALDGLLGFDLEGKTAGVVGTGQIGRIVARLLWHLRCRVLAHDPSPDAGLVELGIEYVELGSCAAQSDVVSLNCPLTPETHHLVNAGTIPLMKPGVMLVNTGRGALIDTAAVVDGLKSGQIGSLALDVYEEEAPLFFEDRSQEIITDDVFARLLTFPNVLITAHQAFLTEEALAAIADHDARQPRPDSPPAACARTPSRRRDRGHRAGAGAPEPQVAWSVMPDRSPTARTLVLLKPDAVERRLVGSIVSRFESRGLTSRRWSCARSTPTPSPATTPSTWARGSTTTSWRS